MGVGLTLLIFIENCNRLQKTRRLTGPTLGDRVDNETRYRGLCTLCDPLDQCYYQSGLRFL